jgi:type II secretory pathway component PulM
MCPTFIIWGRMSSNGAPQAGPAPGPRAWWRGLTPRARRNLRRAGAGAGVLVLLVAIVLARWLSVENDERDADLALVQAEARGDARAMIAQLSGCATNAVCVASVRAVAANPRVRRTGAVKILQLTSATAYSLSGTTGKTRFAWTVLGTLPVVQCITVQRTGNVLTGIHVHLLAISAPIANEGVCGTRSADEIRELEEARELSGQ